MEMQSHLWWYAKVDKKKSGRSKKTNRKVSMMAYSAFRQLLGSKAFSEGVEVIGINPAYTSVIGLVKFGPGYKLTRMKPRQWP